MKKLSNEQKTKLYIILRYGLKFTIEETKDAIMYADNMKKPTN